MKAKIVNKKSAFAGKKIDVEFLDSRYVYGYLSGTREKLQLPFNDVKLVYEYKWEKAVVKYRELLNIKLPKAASIKFYAALCSAIEEHYKLEIESIHIIRDVEEKARTKYWYKNIDMLVNNTHPVNIRITGRNYTDIYDIDIEDIDMESLANECRDDICKLETIIEKSCSKLCFYRGMLNLLEHPESSHKAVEGG